MSEHTKGKWYYWDDLGIDSRKAPAVRDDNGHIVAKCHNPNLPDDVTQANARLIAEAPDMYEHLEEDTKMPEKAHKIMRDNGLVIDNHNDPMQKLAFTFYTMLVGRATDAEALIKEIDNE